MTKTKRKKRRAQELVMPPHANAEVHELIMARLSKMTAQEIFESSVRAGIHTKSGKLRKLYAPQPDDPV